MSASTPAVRISVRCDERLVVEFHPTAGVPFKATTRISLHNVAEYRDKVSNGLNKLRRLSVGKDVLLDQRRACDAMREFIRIQRGNSVQLFGEERHPVQDVLRQALPTWRQSATESNCPPVVQITSSVPHLLPIEFLPLFDLQEPPDGNRLIDLIAMAARFPAFSSIVQRSMLENPGPQSAGELQNTGHLRIRVFQDASTRTARESLALLGELTGVKVIGPWPHTRLEPAVLVRDLAAQLRHGGTPAEDADHIQYFACHCDTRHRNSDDYALLLAHQRGWWAQRTTVTLGALYRAFGAFARRTSTGTLPLIFLNACGGARINPSSVSSFPLFFLENQNCCVIATETPVQDDFAACFAREFYAQFIRVPSCGEALYRARWRLLKDKRNPQGILYSMYGNPDLRLRRLRTIDRADTSLESSVAASDSV
jgi:hypothetical protein